MVAGGSGNSDRYSSLLSTTRSARGSIRAAGCSRHSFTSEAADFCSCTSATSSENVPWLR